MKSPIRKGAGRDISESSSSPQIDVFQRKNSDSIVGAGLKPAPAQVDFSPILKSDDIELYGV